MQFPTQDPYKTLNVKDNASAEEIKRTYRKLARELHPDRAGGDKKKEARFKEVSAAYEVLGDTKKRAQYDSFRRGNPIHSGDNIPIDFGSLFAQMFGGGQPGGTRSRVEYSFGGFEPSFSGDGFRRHVRPPSAQPRVHSTKPKERQVTAKDGSPLLLRGADIYSEVRIGFDQAILGVTSQIPTLEGLASVKIPPGTSSGAKLRLKGKGARKRSSSRGDHYITVHINVPKKIDSEAQKLLHKLMQRVRGK